MDGTHDSTLIKSAILWVGNDLSFDRGNSILAYDILPPFLAKLDAYNVNYKHWIVQDIKDELLVGEREVRMSFDEAW